MKNNLLILFFTFIFQPLFADNLNIQSSNISIDKKQKLTIFEGDVVATDVNNNIFKTNYAEYKKDLKLLESKDKTTILTSKGYFLTGKNIIFDNKNNFIKSKFPASIKDLESIVESVLKSEDKTILIAIYTNQNQRRYIGVKLD